MNYLFLINKKVIITVFFIIALTTIFIITINQDKISKKKLKLEKNNFSYDVLNPKFTINSNKEKILIEANGASFLNKDEILLESNVSFTSKKFTIESPQVYFNKKEQTAYSKKKSIFTSNGTQIKSNGFEILNQGDIIEFNGKTKIILLK